MPVPTWTVEIAFASTPLSTTPTWVDVSQWVLTDGAGPGIRIDRGRTSPLDDFRTGRASFRLRNTDRRFDPLHASGPYFGNLLPGKQVRIRATANAVTTDQFRGFIRGWPQSFDDAGYWAYVDVECYDGLGWLSEARVAGEDVIYDYAASIGTLIHYGSGVSGASWANDADVLDPFTLLYGPMPAASPLPASDFPGVEQGTLRFLSFTGSSVLVTTRTTVSTITCWFRTSASVQSTLFYSQSALATVSSRIRLSATGQIIASAFSDGGGVLDLSSTSTSTVSGFNDGRWHHLAVSSEGTHFEILVDGVRLPVTNTQGVNGTNNTIQLHNIGGAFVTFVGSGTIASETFTGDIALPMAWTTAVSAPLIQQLAAVVSGGFTETTTARAGRILDAVGWPATWRDLTTDPKGVCTSPPFNSAQASNLLRDVEATEQGRLFVAKDGDVTLLHRYWTTEETRGNTIQATFSDDGADIPYSVGGYSQDVDDVLNAVTVSIALTGGSAESTDSTSITNYGRKSTTLNTLLANLNLAREMARGVVLQRKDVLTRIRPVSPAIDLTQAQWATVLGLEIGDRVRLEMTPSRTGTQIQQSATIEGISIEANLSNTVVNFEAAPLPAVTWFQVGTSALNSGHLLGF